MTTKLMGLARNAMKFGLGKSRPATKTEQFLGLALKLHEEVAEVILDPNDVTEYADVLEALIGFAALNGISEEEIMVARKHKADKKGNFQPAVFWEKY